MSKASPTGINGLIPLVGWYPELARVPRVTLGSYPTPVVHVDGLGPTLWIKRDDLSAHPLGGNKVRALEFLLGDTSAGDRVVTVGAVGSTHALAVATYAAGLGAEVFVGRWKQEMNAAATRVEQRVSRIARVSHAFANPIGAYAWATWKRLLGARWIPAGGTSPLGILGHVNAGLELVEQIDAGRLPEPRTVVVPLGTGGTAAGIALAFSIAGCKIAVVGARVVPRIVARKRRVVRLANRTAVLIEQLTRASVPRVSPGAIHVEQSTYGGAYGRETPAAHVAADRLREASGIALDPTYSAKAFAYALELAASGAGGRVLFWLTFDARSLGKARPERRASATNRANP